MNANPTRAELLMECRKPAWQREHLGKTWRDMPGSCKETKKMNFYLFRKGELALTEDGRAPGWMEAAAAAKKAQSRRAKGERTPQHKVLVSGYAPLSVDQKPRMRTEWRKGKGVYLMDDSLNGKFPPRPVPAPAPVRVVDVQGEIQRRKIVMSKETKRPERRKSKTAHAHKGLAVKISTEFNRELFGGPVLPPKEILQIGGRERVSITEAQAAAIKSRSNACRVAQGLTWTEFHKASGLIVSAFYGATKRKDDGTVSRRHLEKLMAWMDSADGLGRLLGPLGMEARKEKVVKPQGGMTLDHGKLRRKSFPGAEDPTLQKEAAKMFRDLTNEMIDEAQEEGSTDEREAEVMAKIKPADVSPEKLTVGMVRDWNNIRSLGEGEPVDLARERSASSWLVVWKHGYTNVVPVWVDLETGGLHPEKNPIVEIAASLDDMWFVRPCDWRRECEDFDLVADQAALAKNGAGDADWPGADTPDVLPVLRAVLLLAQFALGERVFALWLAGMERAPLFLCGANPQFDVDFLNAACARYGLPDLARRGLDVQQEAMALLWDGKPPVPSFRSDSIAEALGMLVEPLPHRAVRGVRQALALHTEIRRRAGLQS